MTFIRDTNRSTGMGAIAAVDQATDRRQRILAARARDLARRDRALAALASRHPLSMGAVSVHTINAATGRTPILQEGGGTFEGGGRTPVQTTFGTPGGKPLPGKKGNVRPTSPTRPINDLLGGRRLVKTSSTPPARPTRPGRGGGGGKPSPFPQTPLVVLPVPPVTLPYPGSSSGGSSTVGTGNGGGGGGSWTPPAPEDIEPLEPMDPVDVPPEPAPNSNSGGVPWKMLLIVGGVLAGYYLLNQD